MKNKNIILTVGAGKPSVKALYPHLEVPCIVVEKKDMGRGKEILRIHEKKDNFGSYTSVPKEKEVIQNCTVIRWGNRVPLNLQNCIVYNKSEASAKASNKRVARELLQEAKVSIPALVTPDTFKEEYLPIIGRPSYHCKCKNLRVLKTKDEFLQHYKINEPKGWYYSQYIDKEHEFRIHCAHGKVLSISEKPKPKNHTDKNPVIGWGYSVVEEEWRVLHWSEYKAKWCALALSAVEAMGLDFGAVDIIIKGKQAYVLEVNTAGSLVESEYLRKRYAMYFNWLLKSKERREHWDFKKFESGKSLAWKNFQLLEK
jgi:hypothetical protein